MFQPSYLPEIQIWLVSGYSRLIESRKKNESLQHKSTRWRCEILGKWTTIVSSKTWAGFATNMWTRCTRQAWPHGSLTTKHYRFKKGNHQRGYQSPYRRHALKKELLLLEQINQWLGVLGIRIEWRWLVYQTIEYFAHAWLTWDDSKENKNNLSRTHGDNLHQMHVNPRRSLLSSKHMLHELTWRNAFKSFQHYLNVQHESWRR